MKYCVPYYRGSPFRYYDEVDEFIINYRKEDTTLPDFLEKYKNKDISIAISDFDNLDLLEDLYHKFNNIKFLLQEWDEEIIADFQQRKIPFFLNLYIDSWDVLNYVIGLKPTDVYITNELGFELDKVAQICHRKKIDIRVIPNLAQSQAPVDDLKRFFIRPEDLEIYADYIDCIELAGNEQQLSVFYKIYAIDKKWFGDLNEIILNFSTSLDSRRVSSIFGRRRIKCGKRCLKGGSCRLCERVAELAKTLEENNFIFTHPSQEN